LNPGRPPDSGTKKWILLHFECYAGLLGTPVFDKTLATNQGTQTQQKTAGSRRFGNRSYGRNPVILKVDVRVWWTADIKKAVGTRAIAPEVKTNQMVIGKHQSIIGKVRVRTDVHGVIKDQIGSIGKTNARHTGCSTGDQGRGQAHQVVSSLIGPGVTSR
jgi:hypothetical protein